MWTTNCGFDSTLDAELLHTETPVRGSGENMGTGEPMWRALCRAIQSNVGIAAPIDAAQRKARDASCVFRMDEVLCGAYRVDAVIGTGGMSQILEATDLRLGRTVAIKVCKPGVSSAYLRSEGRLLGSFCHPSIVAIHDVRIHEGINFLVMQRIYGQSLREYIKRTRGDLSMSEALNILISLCEALSILHEAGVIHRDLKPSNIMLTHENSPVLLDLGVAVREHQDRNAFGMAGSPSYMAPESVDCYAEHAPSPLVDIYSLGCIAYELLTGRVPFKGPNHEWVLAQHLHGSPPSVSNVVEVPGALDQLIAQMMSKCPDDRPQSVQAVEERLRAMLDSLPREVDHTAVPGAHRVVSSNMC